LPLAAAPTRPAPVGRTGALSSAGALLGFAALAAAWVALGPLRDDIAAIRGEGDVAARAPSLASLGRGAPVRDDARAAAVRAEVAPLFAGRRARLAPYLAPPGPLPEGAPRPDRASVAAWAELRRAHAAALARHGLAPAEYALTARADPAPWDALVAAE
jgi:hypothetical protein